MIIFFLIYLIKKNFLTDTYYYINNFFCLKFKNKHE